MAKTTEYGGKDLIARSRERRKFFWGLALFAVICCIFLMSAQFAFAAGQTGTVATTALNIRSGPGTSYRSMGLLSINKEINILDTVTGNDGKTWYYMEYNGINGYVAAEFIVVSSHEEYETDAKFEAYLDAQGFPESYKPYLRTLHAKYPNWNFRAARTGLSWNDVLEREGKLGKSLVSSSAPSSWKSQAAGAYDPQTGKYTSFDSGGWAAASEKIIAYYLDPRNFINQIGIFQFLTHTYDAETQTSAGLAAVVSGTFLDAAFPETGFATYADALMEAGRTATVNPYVLASMILVEQGTSGTGKCISGTVSGYEGYYNYYNIGAYKTASMSAVTRGLWYASRSGSYQRPWDGHFASLLGGALFYSENYVKQNKNTLYFKKWNVMNGLEDVGEGQYMTNVQGAESEAAALRKGYLSLLDSPMIFEIPIYSGMPDAACRKPSGNNASSQPELPKEEEPKIKKEQTVTTNYTRYTRKVTDKGFNLNAKTDGDGVLTYASSDDRIASVDQSGQVRVNGVEGVVTFTVSASETETCRAGSKIVTLTVKKSEEQQEAERLQKMLTLADAIRLKASSTKNAGGSIQVKLTITQGDIAAIEDLGYTVKYKYYRSEKKNADYRSKVEKQTMTPYVNTAGIKNTRYYYKSRVMIYDADGSLAAYTRLDRCSYACRIWTKE
ncbi:MAG: N-acetylglucosaminidase [Clostridia bacterium]